MISGNYTTIDKELIKQIRKQSGLLIQRRQLKLILVDTGAYDSCLLCLRKH